VGRRLNAILTSVSRSCASECQMRFLVGGEYEDARYDDADCSAR
jgi:hypothetical protein